MEYKTKWYQFFNKPLKVPSIVKRKVYRNELTIKDCVRYKLFGKVPSSCLKSDNERKIYDKYGPEKLATVDWDIIFNNVEIVLTPDILNKIDPKTEDINRDLYGLLQFEIKPRYYPEQMKKAYPGRVMTFSARHNYDFDFNRGEIELRDVFNDWETFKDLDFGYNIEKNEDFRYLDGEKIFENDKDFKEFMTKYGCISHLFQFSEVPLKVIISYLNKKTPLNEMELEEVKKVSYTILEKLSSGTIKKDSITQEGYKRLFEHLTVEEYFARLGNTEFSEQIIEELHDYNAVLDCPIPFSAFNTHFGRSTLSHLGINNIIEFEKENGPLFTDNNFDFQIPPLVDENGNVMGKCRTKENFEYMIRTMIFDGLKDHNKNNISYKSIQGPFRDNNPDLFISDDAPEELQQLFYTKTLTFKDIHDHPEYIPFLENINPECGFKSLCVSVNNSEKESSNYINLVRFLSSKGDRNTILNFLADYSYIINLYTGGSWWAFSDIVFKNDESLESIKNRMTSKLFSLGLSAFQNVVDQLPNEVQNMLLSREAPKELQDAFYHNELSTELIEANPSYIGYLKKVDRRFLFKEHLSFHLPEVMEAMGINPNGEKISDKDFCESFMYLRILGQIPLSNLILYRKEGEILTREKCIDALDDCIKRVAIESLYYNETSLPMHFKMSHPEFFISEAAPEELKRAFYKRNISIGYVVENYSEISGYLKNTNFKLLFDHDLASSSLFNSLTWYLVGEETTERVSDEEFLETFKYLKQLERIRTDDQLLSDLKKKYINNHQITASKEEIFSDLNAVLETRFIAQGIHYDGDTVPEYFKSKNPTLFMGEEVPSEIKTKFYNRLFTAEDFRENPNLINYFEKTNIALGFDSQYSIIGTLFQDENDISMANELRLKVIKELSSISNNEVRKTLMNYVLNNPDDVKNDSFKMITNIFRKVVFSNSLELSTFQEQIIKLVLNSDNPEDKLERIENVFERNNVPFCGKMFLCFQILYPEISKKFSTYGTTIEACRIAPQLQDGHVPKLLLHATEDQNRMAVEFNDLLRVAYRTNERTLVEYVDNIDKGNDLYIGLLDGKISMESLSESDRACLDIFTSHMEVLYQNTKRGREECLDLSGCDLEEKLRILSERFQPNERYELKDRIVRSFCFTAGINSFDELKGLMEEAKKEQEERTSKVLDEIKQNGGKFILHEGDFIRCIGRLDGLAGSLTLGNYCKEHLGSINAIIKTDTTPLDIDFTLINSDKENIYQAVYGTPTGFGFGNVFIVIKKENPNYYISKDNENIETNAPYDPKKIEMFRTGYNSHFGARTGISLLDIDCIIYKKEEEISSSKPYDDNGNVNYVTTEKSNEIRNDLPAIKYEIAKNGVYIPVVDFAGKIIFTQEEFEEIRGKMEGLKHYGEETFHLSPNLVTPDVQTIVDSITPESIQTTIDNREKVFNVIRSALEEMGIEPKYQIDKDVSLDSTAEILDTGSTGRATNVPNDGDYDLLMRIDNEIIADPEKRSMLVGKIKEKFEHIESEYIGITDKGDLRIKQAKFDADTTLDVDVSFVKKTDKMDYSTEECIRDRLSSIREQYPDQYQYVVANIILAKEVLQDPSINVYKTRRKDSNQGGLGGVGVENWILQNGGSFIDAVDSFISAATNEEGQMVPFEEFREKYQIWDFGKNHFAVRDGTYPHDNFVYDNMNEMGYKKMYAGLMLYREKTKNGQKTIGEKEVTAPTVDNGIHVDGPK